MAQIGQVLIIIKDCFINAWNSHGLMAYNFALSPLCSLTLVHQSLLVSVIREGPTTGEYPAHSLSLSLSLCLSSSYKQKVKLASAANFLPI